MVEKIFANANILTGKELDIVEGYLKVKNGDIIEIGEGDPNSYDIDVRDGFIIPPFIDAHTHVADSVRKDLYIGKSQSEVVGDGGKKFKVLESSSDEEKIEAIETILNEMRDSGILSYCDFREGGIDGCKLINNIFNKYMESFILSRPKKGENLDDLLSVCDGIGIPSLNFLPEKDLKNITKRVREAGKMVSVHVSETKGEHERSIQETGKSEIERAVELDPSFLVHGTWASRDDLKILKGEEIPLILCPRSNSLLSVGIPRINQVLEEDVEIWLATDNVSACSPNMFQELSYAWSILRLQSKDVGPEEARELLKAATVNPIQKLDVSLEPISEENKASFVILSKDSNIQRCIDPYVGLVNRARASNVREIYRPSLE